MVNKRERISGKTTDPKQIAKNGGAQDLKEYISRTEAFNDASFGTKRKAQLSKPKKVFFKNLYKTNPDRIKEAAQFFDVHEDWKLINIATPIVVLDDVTVEMIDNLQALDEDGTTLTTVLNNRLNFNYHSYESAKESIENRQNLFNALSEASVTLQTVNDNSDLPRQSTVEESVWKAATELARKSDPELIMQLYDVMGFNPKKADKIVQRAVKSGNKPLLDYFIQSDRAQVNVTWVIEKMAANNRPDLLKGYLESNEEGVESITPDQAAKKGHVEVITILFNSNWEPGDATIDGALHHQRYRVIKLFIKNNSLNDKQRKRAYDILNKNNQLDQETESALTGQRI